MSGTSLCNLPRIQVVRADPQSKSTNKTGLFVEKPPNGPKASPPVWGSDSQMQEWPCTSPSAQHHEHKPRDFNQEIAWADY